LITPTQKKRLHCLLNQTGNANNKAVMIIGFTEGRTEHSSEMTQQEAFEMIDHLQLLLPDKYSPLGGGGENKMRRKIISQAYEMGWAKPGDWKKAVAAIDKFCTGEHGKYKKPLQKHTYAELVQVVSQFGQLYKSYLLKD
jgi:hypothetical protein